MQCGQLKSFGKRTAAVPELKELQQAHWQLDAGGPLAAPDNDDPHRRETNGLAMVVYGKGMQPRRVTVVFLPV